MINYKRLVVFFALICMTQLIASVESKKRELKIKNFSTERVEALVEHYKKYVKRERIKDVLSGTSKISALCLAVYGIYYFITPIETDACLKTNDMRRIYNDVIIGTIVALFLTGVNNSIANIANAWDSLIVKKSSSNMLCRFLYEVRRYKLLIASIKEENSFISEYAIIIAYNRIIIALEHLIAWSRAQKIDARKKIIFDSIHIFNDVLEEYKPFLIDAQNSRWSHDVCKKLANTTHAFLQPWLDLLTPEIHYE